MARKAFPIRLEEADIAQLETLAKSLGIPKTQIVEDGLRMNLVKLQAYEAMDRGPPKSKGVALALGPGVICSVEKLKPRRGAEVKLTGGTRPIRGYDAATGEPIYRGA